MDLSLFIFDNLVVIVFGLMIYLGDAKFAVFSMVGGFLGMYTASQVAQDGGVTIAKALVYNPTTATWISNTTVEANNVVVYLPILLTLMDFLLTVYKVGIKGR